jgi:hypothetical protein
MKNLSIRLLFLSALALFMCAQMSSADAQSTRSSMNAFNNQYFTAAGKGTISGPIGNAMNSLIINGMGSLSDSNVWTGSNTFSGPVMLGGQLYGVLQGTIGAISGTMTGYNTNDQIVLQCPSIMFLPYSSPSLGVQAASGGAVQKVVVSYSGQTYGPMPPGPITCTQASTTNATGGAGGGAGFQIQVYFGPTWSIAGGGTGGAPGDNENLFCNHEDGDTVPSQYSGGESVLCGPGAGRWLAGGSNSLTGMGVSVLGGHTGVWVVLNNDSCFGNDCERNAGPGDVNSNGFGEGALRNNAGTENGCFGINCMGSWSVNSTGLLTGGYNFGGGNNVMASCTTCLWNTIVGQHSAANDGSHLNFTGSFNSTFGGNDLIAAGFNGSNISGVGFGALVNCTTCNGVVFLGENIGPAVTTGIDLIYISSQTGSTDECGNGNESWAMRMCSDGGWFFQVTGTVSPSTSKATLAGTLTIAGLPTSSPGSGGGYLCVDSVGDTYRKSSCP